MRCYWCGAPRNSSCACRYCGNTHLDAPPSNPMSNRAKQSFDRFDAVRQLVHAGVIRGEDAYLWLQ